MDLSALDGITDPQALRALLADAQAIIAHKDALLSQRDQSIERKEALIGQLRREIARLRRLQFSARSERMDPEQRQLFEETMAADIAAVEAQLEALSAEGQSSGQIQQPRKASGRKPLPEHLARVEVRHEPACCTCPQCDGALVAIGEHVSERLACKPLDFYVRRDVYPQYACKACEQVVAEPVAAAIIERGQADASLLAQVTIAKYVDHLPLYRQEAIFERAGHAIARSTLAQWVGECGVQLQPLVDALAAEMRSHDVLHADETPVAMLKPAHLRDGKTHRAYLWSYCTTQFNPLKAVVFDFADSRGGQHVRDFLGLPGTQQNPGWQGKLVTDDFSGYKACFELGVTEVGCMAHARRKFHELWANHQSQVGEQALKFFARLYEVEREVADCDPQQRCEVRRRRSRHVVDALHQWLRQTRQKVPEGSATAKAIGYSLNRWAALTRYIDDGELPIDNNWVENQIRPIAIGRNNWLFAGSLRAGKRAAAIMSLVHSARLNGHEPYAYLRDVLERLPTQPASRIAELLPHSWRPNAST